MSIKTDNEHYKRIEQYAKEIQRLYYEVAAHSVNLSLGVRPKGDIFYFKDYPVLKRKIDKLFDEMFRSMNAIIKSGISSEWDKANENNDELLERLSKTINLPKGKYQTRNLKALEAFQQRKIGGLNLSDRVWNYTNQFKGEIEQALDVGIADGRSAAELSRDVRNYLREPKKLFRKVRDKNGNLQLSKNSLKYNPGNGVYRSSYKNAMRLTRTEINTAYRTSDYERWQQMDFVVGIEVRRSNREFACDVCESLKGKYPKDFKFTQWHVLCRCHAISILATEKELLESLENDTPIQSKNEVKDVPDEFKDWVGNNEQRIERAKQRGTDPWWMRDNRRFVDESLPKNIFKNQTKEEYLDASNSQKITLDERNAIYGPNNGYVRNTFSWTINDYHRGKINPIKSVENRIQSTSKILDNVISNNKTSEDLFAYRMVDEDFLKNKLGVSAKDIGSVKNLSGMDITDKGYMSCSTVENLNVFKDRDVILKIQVPKGKNCFFANNEMESEIIFKRGQKHTILGYEIKDNKVILLTKLE